MGKRRRHRSELVAAAPAPMAERHTFAGGVLGHDAGAEWLVNVNESTALAVDTVYACVRLIADAVAGATWGEWIGDDQLPESRLVRRPAATMTRREWTWRVSATLALYNVCYLRRVGGLDSEGVPRSIVPLTPGRLVSTFAGLLLDGETIGPDEIVTMRRAWWPSVSAEVGTVLGLARETIAASLAADAYRSDFWQQGGAPVVVLTTDQELTDTAADAIADRWTDKRRTSPGRPAVLGKGAHAERLGADVGTEGAAKSGDRLGASVARYFGMPAYMVNAPTEAGPLTYANTESFGLDLVRYTLSAYSSTIGDTMSAILPGDYLLGRRVELDLSHLTRAEQESRYRAWAIALGTAAAPGWMTRAEVRRAEGLPADDGLDPAGSPAPALEGIAV